MMSMILTLAAEEFGNKNRFNGFNVKKDLNLIKEAFRLKISTL
jgi:hypothetical protein